MGIRIEFILSVFILTVVLGAFNIELDMPLIKEEVFTKELSFTDTTFREVDKNALQEIAYGTEGLRDAGVLTLYNVKYATEKIESLVAKKAMLKGEILYLEGNVVFLDKEGYLCKTEKASYHQTNEILTINTPYVSIKGRTKILGETLRYELAKEEIYSTSIDAVIYTVDK
jgi:hypothetical protein